MPVKIFFKNPPPVTPAWKPVSRAEVGIETGFHAGGAGRNWKQSLKNPPPQVTTPRRPACPSPSTSWPPTRTRRRGAGPRSTTSLAARTGRPRWRTSSAWSTSRCASRSLSGESGGQSWTLLVFLKFSNHKKWSFAFFIKLVTYFCTSPV